jgi:Tfp pilus assembly protein PilF
MDERQRGRRNHPFASTTGTSRGETGVAERAHHGSDPLARAASLLEAGRADEARNLLSDILAKEPHNLEAEFWLGVCLLRLGSFEAAQTTFAHLHSLGNNDYRAAYNLGLALEGQGQIQEARNAYRKALNMNPNLREAQEKLARVTEDHSGSAQGLDAQATARTGRAPRREGPQLGRVSLRGGVVGTARRVRTRFQPFTRQTILSFVVEGENSELVPVEMGFRLLHGSVEEGDLVEVRGRRRKGTIVPGHVRNLTTGAAVEGKGSTLGFKVLATAAWLIGFVFFAFVVIVILARAGTH